MGNCQTAETEVAVLQHPDGKIERLYWPTAAIEVMRINPGHYVALATTLSLPTSCTAGTSSSSSNATPTTVRLTKLRLLPPKETLVHGRVYRLVTSQEVAKALRVRKQERVRQQQKHHQMKRPTSVKQDNEDEVEVEVDVSGEIHLGSDQMTSQEAGRLERHRQKAAQSAAKARQWRPSLQSISEAVS